MRFALLALVAALLSYRNKRGHWPECNYGLWVHGYGTQTGGVGAPCSPRCAFAAWAVRLALGQLSGHRAA